MLGKSSANQNAAAGPIEYLSDTVFPQRYRFSDCRLFFVMFTGNFLNIQAEKKRTLKISGLTQ